MVVHACITLQLFLVCVRVCITNSNIISVDVTMFIVPQVDGHHGVLGIGRQHVCWCDDQTFEVKPVLNDCLTCEIPFR